MSTTPTLINTEPQSLAPSHIDDNMAGTSDLAVLPQSPAADVSTGKVIPVLEADDTSIVEMEGLQLPLGVSDEPVHDADSHLTQGFDTKTFHSFAKLPAELRLMILRYMLPGPRVLELQKHTPRCRGVEAFFTHEPVPAVMHVCSEFRKEAQKYYKRHFPRYDSYNDGRLQAEAQITLNLNKDIIYVRCIFEVVNDEMSAEDLDRIQFLALDAGVSDSLYMFHTLHNLKELILVIDMNPFGRGLDGASTRRDIVFEDVRPLTAGGDWISMEEYMQVEGKPLVYVNHMGEGLDHVWDNRMIGLENDVNGFVDRVARLKEEHPEWNMPLVKIALRKMTAASMEELAELHEELQQRSQSPVEYNEWKGQTKPPNLIYEDSYSEESSSDGSPSDED